MFFQPTVVFPCASLSCVPSTRLHTPCADVLGHHLLREGGHVEPRGGRHPCTAVRGVGERERKRKRKRETRREGEREKKRKRGKEREEKKRKGKRERE